MLRSLVQRLSGLHLHHAGASLSVATREAMCCGGAAVRALPQPHLQHARTTFVLRRKYNLPLNKAHQTTRAKRLKSRHFIYCLIEDTNLRKRDPIKLILKTSVEGIGSAGDVIEISPHKARRDLLLPGLAAYATPENVKKYSDLAATKKDQPSSPFALITAKVLSNRIFLLSMNMDNPWTIEPWHVRVGLRKAGFIVPEEAITMPPHPIIGPDLNLQGKEFAVMIKINNKEEAVVRCRIHHFTPDPRRNLTNLGRYWERPTDPLFDDQRALLEEINANDKRIQMREEFDEEKDM